MLATVYVIFCLHVIVTLGWKYVESADPVQIGREMESMPVEKRCIFILDGLNCQYAQEWGNMCKMLINVVYKIYYEYINAVSSRTCTTSM